MKFLNIINIELLNKMITEEEYKNALNVISQYGEEQNFLAKNGGQPNIYNLVVAQMISKVPGTTIEEVEYLIETWCRRKKKELQCKEYEK